MSDTFVHPEGVDMQKYGAVVRLPHTCWLATNTDQPDTHAATRAQCGLPPQGAVLCALLPAMMIDPTGFGLWMRMLGAIPDAVLWLPAYGAAARRNLYKAATAAGVDASRLVFMAPCSRPQMLARMRLADLFVDAVRFNANYGLADALRMGVPAISCAGQNMASRLGGSIVRAAGLGDCVFDTPDAYLQAAIQLGRDPEALAALRLRLAGQLSQAPLFDVQARVRDWESAWSTMAQRQREGLPPQAFDVAPTRD